MEAKKDLGVYRSVYKHMSILGIVLMAISIAMFLYGIVYVGFLLPKETAELFGQELTDFYTTHVIPKLIVIGFSAVYFLGYSLFALINVHSAENLALHFYNTDLDCKVEE